MKLACTACHKGAEKGERAGFPARADCAVCHPNPSELGSKLPLRRVYRVADYVFFSHARHRAAKIECTACHGSVTDHDVVRLERPVTMKACVDCHKTHNATQVCTACHELAQ